MTKAAGVIETTPITHLFKVKVLPQDKGLEFELMKDEYVLLHFENVKTFNRRWKLLHRGINTLMFNDVTTPTNVQLFRENDTKTGFVVDKAHIPPIPPPPGTIL